jgi:hypothetical protein
MIILKIIADTASLSGVTGVLSYPMTENAKDDTTDVIKMQDRKTKNIGKNGKAALKSRPSSCLSHLRNAGVKNSKSGKRKGRGERMAGASKSERASFIKQNAIYKRPV